MNKPRVIETNEGIQNESTVDDYDRMQRGFRDRGILETKAIIKSGINNGHAVEIGPGPGYLGLEWLSATEGTRLTGVEISPAMIAKARENSRKYGLSDRVGYVGGSALSIPLADESRDAVFSNGSLHEWEDPLRVLSEAFRILKPEGRLYISDLKRNISVFLAFIMRLTAKGTAMKRGLMSSIAAAYTVDELRKICNSSPFRKISVTETAFGLELKAVK